VTERTERKGALSNKLGQRADDGVLLTEACAEPRTNALRCPFLHLRFCMLTTLTIENEYLENALDVQDGADKIHGPPAMAQALRVAQHNASNPLPLRPRLPPANLG
jgi:hypothetical protein